MIEADIIALSTPRIPTPTISTTQNPITIKIFLILTDITTFAVYFILGLLIFIIKKVHLPQMGALKYCFYLNIGISIIFVTLLAILKPLILFPFAVIYPLGWLSPLKAMPTLILSTFALNCLAIFVDILVSMLAQRYFFTRIMIKKDFHWIQYIFYSLLWGTNFICCFSCTFILSYFSSSSKNIANLIAEKHPTGMALLSKQPSLTGFMDYSAPEITNFFKIIIFFAFSRLFSIIILTILNYRLLAKHSPSWTIKTQKMLQMFLKSIFAQASVLIFAGGGPGILTIILFIFPNLPFAEAFWMFSLWCAFAFSVLQTIAIIIFTPPFLIFFKKKFHLIWGCFTAKLSIIRINNHS